MKHALSAIASLTLVGLATIGAAPATPRPASQMTMNGYEIQTPVTHWNSNSGDFKMPQEVKIFRTSPSSDARGDNANGNTKGGLVSLHGNVVVHDSGQAPEAREVGPDYSGTATITCDTLNLDSKNKIYEAVGNFHFTQGDRTGTADRGILNQTTHMLHLEGNVLVSQGESSMRGSVMDYNLVTHDVDARGTPVIIRQPVQNGSAPAPTTSASPKPKPKKRR